MAAQIQSSKLPRISVILPIYNTGACLEELYARLRNTLELCGHDFEFIMVDDGSPDGAHVKLEELARMDSRIKAIILSRNFGQHPAISAGLEHATGDVVVLMDADLQDRPEDIPLFLASLKDGVDIVYSVKQNSAEGFLQRLTSKLYHYVFSRITRTNVPNNIGTFRLFRGSVRNAMLQYSERNVLYGPLMFYIGFHSTTISVDRLPRKTGRSGYSFGKRLALAINSLLSYTDIPHRVLIGTGIFIFGATLLYMAALLARYFFDDKPLLPGLTLLALLITGSLGVTMFSLGIIGAYIFRVYQEVLARPRYLIARTLNVDNSKE